MLKNWRADRFLRFSIPFILTYSVLLGMLMVNLGIIARQRVFLFPFLFLLLHAAPGGEPKREGSATRPRPEPRPQPRSPLASSTSELG